MARIPRSLRAPGALDPGQTYHVANRGPNRADIFHSDFDRIVFLAMFSEACRAYGAVCHAFCLMTNHFHLVVEDRLGTLAQVMHRLQSCYASYFNRTRAIKHTGPVFESRYRAEQIDSREYFEAACAYVFLNPLRTKTPLAASAQDYRWSSASFVCSDATPAAWAEGLLAPWDGVEGVLAAMRPSKYKSSLDLRRARMEALVSGAWLERDRVLGDRTPEEYRRHLAERAARGARGLDEDAADALASFAAEEEADGGTERAPMPTDAPTPSTVPIASPSLAVIPLRSVVPSPLAVDPTIGEPTAEVERVRFAGVAMEEATAETIREACERLLPSSLIGTAERMADVVAYVLHRFTNASTEALAASAKRAVDVVDAAVEWVRGQRRREVGWDKALWGIEWGLRWKLRAGPHRA